MEPDNSMASAGKAAALSKTLARIDLDGHDLPPSPAPSSPRNGRKYALATELVYTESNDQYNASSVPIYQVIFHFIRLTSFTDNPVIVCNIQTNVWRGRGRIRLHKIGKSYSNTFRTTSG
jgi:hypothetical protein